jgi:mannose-1-phosphate guanylyltransferase
LIDIDEEDEYKKEKTYSVESSSNSKVYQNYKNIIGWREKPEISGSINIGCYVLKPEFLEFIPKSVTFRMDDAVRKVLLLSEDQKRLVKGFTIQSSTNFVDIGDKQSYLNVHREYVRKLGRI